MKRLFSLMMLSAGFVLLGAGCVLPWQRTTPPSSSSSAGSSPSTGPFIMPRASFVTLTGEIEPSVTGSLRLTLDEERLDGIYTDPQQKGWAWGSVSSSRLLFSLFLNQRESDPFSVTGTWSADGRELIAQISSSSTAERLVTLRRDVTEPVTFELQTYRNAWHPNENEGCDFRAVYPMVNGGSSIEARVQEKMNQAIQRAIGLSATTTLQQQGEAFMQDCKEEVLVSHREQGTSTDMLLGVQRLHDQGVRMTYNKNQKVSLNIGVTTYSGGAHDAFAITGLTIDTRTGDALSFDDLIPAQYLPAFQQEVHKRLLDTYGEQLFEETAASIRAQLNGGSSTSSQSFRDFAAAQNFNLMPDGLDIFYQQYEVAPYAVGIPEVFFTFEELKTYGFEETSGG